jgi:hypothetical protein
MPPWQSLALDLGKLKAHSKVYRETTAGMEWSGEWSEHGERSGVRSGEPAERNVVRPAFIIYSAYIYILYYYILDMHCVLINLCHMYVVVSIVTESDYFSV